MPRSGGDEIAVNNNGLVNVRRLPLLNVEGALGDRRRSTALDTTGGGEDLYAVTDRGNRLRFLKKVPRDREKIFIVAQILRSPSAREEQPGELRRIDVAKRGRRL